MRTHKDFFKRLSNITDHHFGKEFDERFCKDLLTQEERDRLLLVAEVHFRRMLYERSFFEFSLKRNDKYDLSVLLSLYPFEPLLAQLKL